MILTPWYRDTWQQGFESQVFVTLNRGPGCITIDGTPGKCCTALYRSVVEEVIEKRNDCGTSYNL